jgi:hypothetical protein
MKTNYSGYAIALAWPHTYCKQAGAWYDGVMNILGISKNNYYKVGHAALVLVNKETSTCHYFDFGRYHAPFGHGRVRDEETDHDLTIHTKANFCQNGNLLNYEEILRELSQNESCHGTGDLHASITHIHFQKAYQKAKWWQDNSPHKYGPFVPKGTNCSRFVKSVIASGLDKNIHYFKLNFQVTISPSPIGNVWALKNKMIVSNG